MFPVLICPFQICNYAVFPFQICPFSDLSFVRWFVFIISLIWLLTFLICPFQMCPFQISHFSVVPFQKCPCSMFLVSEVSFSFFPSQFRIFFSRITAFTRFPFRRVLFQIARFHICVRVFRLVPFQNCVFRIKLFQSFPFHNCPFSDLSISDLFFVQNRPFQSGPFSTSFFIGLHCSVAFRSRTPIFQVSTFHNWHCSVFIFFMSSCSD